MRKTKTESKPLWSTCCSGTLVACLRPGTPDVQGPEGLPSSSGLLAFPLGANPFPSRSLSNRKNRKKEGKRGRDAEEGAKACSTSTVCLPQRFSSRIRTRLEKRRLCFRCAHAVRLFFFHPSTAPSIHARVLRVRGWLLARCTSWAYPIGNSVRVAACVCSVIVGG